MHIKSNNRFNCVQYAIHHNKHLRWTITNINDNKETIRCGLVNTILLHKWIGCDKNVKRKNHVKQVNLLIFFSMPQKYAYTLPSLQSGHHERPASSFLPVNKTFTFSADSANESMDETNSSYPKIFCTLATILPWIWLN